MGDYPAVRVQLRDFSSNKIAYTLPAWQLTSFDDLLERAYIPLFRNPRVYEAHLHFNNYQCGEKVMKEKWESGEYLHGLSGNDMLTVWVHYVRRPGRDRYGFPLDGGEEEEDEDAGEQRQHGADRDKSQRVLGSEPLQRLPSEMSSGGSDEEEEVTGERAVRGCHRDQRVGESPLFERGPPEDYIEKRSESPEVLWSDN
ncbi:hypothetical protein CC80DRAFT_555092 [Byssothecium circinans]|uniref:Uncharacterized protein n=1 Tax=Byssothecium circinans TaxID=147558 RepID=A0A6A5TBR5_9PLEO|nr:hypothetical protein CC80DRAFT_555092 [Byssothecium circinans]